eukprot:TRINITY_DN3068_c4_g2_i1.p1 TRINITY_DN3068_c4_g2~~TRINITY_DN3068_c4_g2_i1.p1  ORF type:complete len:101 (+),score=13.21 TRINITY_DN3068_c4_g2_i1:132-434(+)
MGLHSLKARVVSQVLSEAQREIQREPEVWRQVGVGGKPGPRVIKQRWSFRRNKRGKRSRLNNCSSASDPSERASGKVGSGKGGYMGSYGVAYRWLAAGVK